MPDRLHRGLTALIPAYRRLALTGWVLSGAVLGHAAVWQSDHWAVKGAVQGGLGYDSNLLASAGGYGDAYALVGPTFSIQRLHSLTLLEVEVTANAYSYLDHSEFNSIDPALVFRSRYPYDDEAPATQEFAASASRRSEANSDVGGRLRHDDIGARWEGTFNLTGKTRLLARTNLQHTDYLTPGYNTNDSVTGGLTAAYVANERLQLGAGYDFEYSRTRPDNPAQQQTEGRAHQFTLRGVGEFLPKVTGRAYAGVSHTDYRGRVTRTDLDFIAGVSLAWQATARGELAWKADRLNYFSPDGSTSTHTSLGLEWTQEISGGIFATLGADAAQVLYRDYARTRRDHLYGGRFQLRYALTERFSAIFITRYTQQDSDAAFGNYDRITLFGNLTFKF